MIIVVIGAGIVGLHVSLALLGPKKNHDIYLLDQESHLGEHTSGRNSGVIHAGIFYQPGSFKEKVCIEGNFLTYEWLKKLKVPYTPCGKWIVSDPGQEKDLDLFFEKISKLPIASPILKTADEVIKEEPALRKTRAILVPSTGILDAADYVNKLARYAETLGVNLITNCKVNKLDKNLLDTTRGEIPFDLAINSAGLFADELARISGLENYEIKPCRGDYYLISQAPIKRPVYHPPYTGAHGLGVHLTPTLDGNTLLGPNAFFIDHKTDYQHHSSPEDFQKSLAYYLPSYASQQLNPAYSGNRPRLYHQGKPLTEFTIIKRKNWVHLLGIESPGLTAAPALAQEVLKLI